MVTPSLATLLLRLFAGISGGLLGVIVSLLIVFLSLSAQEGTDKIASAALTTSFSSVTVLAMVFLGTLVSNMIVTIFLGLLEKEKYHRLRSTVFQVFVFTLVLFIFFIPAYLLAGEGKLNVAGLHFLSAALMTTLILEIMSGWKYCLTGLMGVLTSGTILYAIFALLTRFAFHDSILLILALPLIWICILTSVFLVEVIHSSLSQFYGTEPLSPEQDHGDPLPKK